MKKSDVIREKFIPHATVKSKYSADARIKKIRQDSLKSLAKERYKELPNRLVPRTCDGSSTSSKYRASTMSKGCAKPQISSAPKVLHTVSYTKPRDTTEAKVESVIGK